MRGSDQQQHDMFSYVSPEERVPKKHPLRRIRFFVEKALKDMDEQFDEMYAQTGRPSIAPEKLIRALLLQMFYSVRSERLLMEMLDYNLLFRWFVGMNMDERVWDASTFSKNRDRLLAGNVAKELFARVVRQAEEEDLVSDEHFTVDGTLIKAWASDKSFQRKSEPKDPKDPKGPKDQKGEGSNPTVDFRGEKRSNETHESTTDPEALLARKGNGKEAKLSYNGNLLTENRNGLIVDAELLAARGTAEREAAVEMVRRHGAGRRMTVGADKGYDTRGFVKEMRELGATPHVAQNTKRSGGSAIDGRTTRHAGYVASQRKRKLVEEPFGWMKTVAGLQQTRHRGKDRVGWVFVLACAAYDLVRLGNLLPAPVPS
jgi:transposase